MNWRKIDFILQRFSDEVQQHLTRCGECVCKKVGHACTRETCEENILRCWFEQDGKLEEAYYGEEDKRNNEGI